jgi:hypothetical protein
MRNERNAGFLSIGYYDTTKFTILEVSSYGLEPVTKHRVSPKVENPD